MSIQCGDKICQSKAAYFMTYPRRANVSHFLICDKLVHYCMRCDIWSLLIAVRRQILEKKCFLYCSTYYNFVFYVLLVQHNLILTHFT